MSDLTVLAFAVPVITLCLGFIIGGRMEASYWAEHGENGGSVHHRGKFYRIFGEAK